MEAWDADQCAPVKHQLRALVDAKAIEVDRRIAELTQLGHQLRSTSAVLAAAPVEGPYEKSCGCTTAADTAGGSSECGCGSSTCGSPAASVTMGATISDGPACSLGNGEMIRRIGEWHEMLESAIHSEATPAGVRLTFDASTDLAEVARLIAAERDCCSFFTFDLMVNAASSTLELTAPPEGQSLLARVFGEAS